MNEYKSFDLTNKKALVTGAGRGIGLGLAVALAEAGAEVTLAARSKKEVSAAAEAICAQGQKGHALVLDVLNTELVAGVVKEKGPFQILVNNAGIVTIAPLDEAKLTAGNELINVNQKGCSQV